MNAAYDFEKAAIMNKFAQMSDGERQAYISILDDTEELRRLIGNQRFGDTCGVNLPILKAAYDILEADRGIQARYFYLYGFIQGKRAERQRRKRKKSK